MTDAVHVWGMSKSRATREAEGHARMKRRAIRQKWLVIGVALAAILPLVASLAVPLLEVS